ncbi:MAG: hypothetical protein ACK56F_18980, partial [bacterium]
SALVLFPGSTVRECEASSPSSSIICTCMAGFPLAFYSGYTDTLWSMKSLFYGVVRSCHDTRLAVACEHIL